MCKLIKEEKLANKNWGSLNSFKSYLENKQKKKAETLVKSNKLLSVCSSHAILFKDFIRACMHGIDTHEKLLTVCSIKLTANESECLEASSSSFSPFQIFESFSLFEILKSWTVFDFPLLLCVNFFKALTFQPSPLIQGISMDNIWFSN